MTAIDSCKYWNSSRLIKVLYVDLFILTWICGLWLGCKSLRNEEGELAGKIISGILIVIFLACLPFLVLLDNLVQTNIRVETSKTALDNFKLDIEDGIEKMAKNMSKTSKKLVDNLTLDMEDSKKKMEKDLNTVFKAIVNNDSRKTAIKNVSKEDLCTQISSAFQNVNCSKLCRPKED